MKLDPLVKPRSVAIVGATDRVGPGRSVIESLGAIGFSGTIYPVNPKYQTVLNHVCYPSLTDLPEAPDVVVFSIRKPLLPEQVRLAVKRGARAAVIYDSGFAELGAEGARQQAEIAGLCREAGMAVCGPNCMGILNPTARVTTYKQTVMDTTGLAGNVGFVSQSGSVCIAILSDLRRYGISLSVSAGNEAVTKTVDYLEYLIDDSATKVIATFTETVREPERYVAALDRAADAGKPVVVLKVGRTERTQRAITSHTGGLAGESRVFSELLRAHRAIEVNDLDEMTEVLAVCQGARWPRGRGISVITGSGGLAEMILDNATAAGLDLPPLSGEERAEAERVIGRITGDGNPFDAWGNGDYAVNLPHAMSVVDNSERIDAIVYCADTSNEGHLGHPGRILENVKMLADAAKGSHKSYYLMSSRPGVMNSQQAKALREAGLVQIGGTRQGLGAIDRVGRYVMGRKPVRTPASRPRAKLADVLAAKPDRRTINEYDAKRLLAEFGVPVTREHRVATIAEATRAARELGYPVVLKALSDDIPHKTELGLVAVGLAGDDELARAFAQLREKLDRIEPRPSDTALLVQEFVKDGIEVFAGVSRDPDFGLSLAFGMGGIAVEVTRDFALRMLPLREGDAEAMIAETRGVAMLGSIRGRPAADVASLAACLEALADFAQCNADVLDEIDLNPIKALPAGRGCVVVDALIVTQPPTG
ncbi:MAG TPA: acetate--CoA ligase family protein [Xanthobacteraceae bacterium]